LYVEDGVDGRAAGLAVAAPAEVEMSLAPNIIAAALLLFATLAGAQTPPATENARGELLYQTHCIGCHGVQVHWRDRKLAADWPSLQAQVRRWQEASGLAWSDAEIADVARYLNRLHYHYSAPEAGVALSSCRTAPSRC
jgi:mono/diheme cytochrome c family protein